MRIGILCAFLAFGSLACVPKPATETKDNRSGAQTSAPAAEQTPDATAPTEAQTEARTEVPPSTEPDKDATSTSPGGEVVTEAGAKLTGEAVPMMDEAAAVSDFASLPEKAPDQADDSPSIDPAAGFNLTTTPTIVLDKQGRDGNRYVMMSNGDFFRFIAAQSNLKCQITTMIADFKISMHESDAALLYYIRTESGANNLYVLNKIAATTTGSTCPKTTATKILPNIKKIDGKFKYTVVSNTSKTVVTNVVNMALSTNNNGVLDQLVGWGNVSAIFSLSGVKDYIMNECWAVETKSFNNSVAFALTNNNEIWKINGNDPLGQSKKDPKLWTSFGDFKAFYKVCELINPPQPPAPNVVAAFYRSDFCSSNLLSTITFSGSATAAAKETQCQAFASANTSSIWAVKIDNVCYDLSDMPALEACRRSQVAPTAPTTVAMYRSDFCSGNVLGFYKYDPSVNIDSYCTSMTASSTSSVWGIKVGTGACIDISDSPIGTACHQFRYMGTPVPTGGKAVNYHRSDFCNGSFLGRMIMTADQTANNAACSAMAPRVTSSVWGIQRGTTACENISDTTFATACANFR